MFGECSSCSDQDVAHRYACGRDPVQSFLSRPFQFAPHAVREAKFIARQVASAKKIACWPSFVTAEIPLRGAVRLYRRKTSGPIIPHPSLPHFLVHRTKMWGGQIVSEISAARVSSTFLIIAIIARFHDNYDAPGPSGRKNNQSARASGQISIECMAPPRSRGRFFLHSIANRPKSDRVRLVQTVRPRRSNVPTLVVLIKLRRPTCFRQSPPSRSYRRARCGRRHPCRRRPARRRCSRRPGAAAASA
jgi:hypothetical protein